ncbi:MAG: hypothetical protein SFV54_05850 [Bryobacteraceae bacterium]|nr:hypothetical protein [Bryobacteraceae bacterium]
MERVERVIANLLGGEAGQGVVVNGEGNRIVLDFPNLQSAFQMLQPWSGREKRAELFERLHEALRMVGLSLVVQVKGRIMAELGAEAKGGPVLRLLGVA